MIRSITRFFLLACVILEVMAMVSCANIIPPAGGPRDSLPPKLVMALPKDSAVNIKSKMITLTFDEYVTLQNQYTNVIVSPNPSFAGTPTIDSKLRNVTVKLKDSLEPNTTYSINFADVIRDVNEGNIAKNFTYVFSTGNTIDYNTYSGKVLLAEQGKADSSLVVVLHRNLNDSAIRKLDPRYFARINGKGEFTFRNLPKGEFAVYAISDKQKKYTDTTQMIAFRSTPVTISANTPHDTLYAFEAFKRDPATPTTTSNATSVKQLPANKEDKRLRYMTSLEGSQQDLLSSLALTFNRKLTVFDSTKIVLYDTNYTKINGYSVTLDTGKTKVMISYAWKENQAFRLLIPKDAVADSAGITLLKADTVRFYTKKETDYGSVRIRFGNIDLSKNPVLQLVQNNKLIESIPLTTAEFQRKRMKPGSYELRILFDANKNGIWDTGSFLNPKRQPEIVYLIPQQLAIRANWDNEVTISL